ncbi:leucine-rich repeats and immunoglobulin-like domains protein 2 [Zophobas morio]|uniref:leucine-rich repeats and immunoglobulin-like domains protein 2 n=1 Tax=Zophobas morio TaxID=2755281 RepID=UPI003082C8BB
MNYVILMLLVRVILGQESKCQKLDMPYSLSLKNNQLTLISNISFSNLDSLQYLDLSRNSISSIEDSAFSWLPALKSLNLERNGLTSIGKNLFQGLIRIEILHLAHNHISSISSGAFTELKTLKYLYLNSNVIVAIGPSAFHPLFNPRELGLTMDQTFQCCSRVHYEKAFSFTDDRCTFKATTFVYNNFYRGLCEFVSSESYVSERRHAQFVFPKVIIQETKVESGCAKLYFNAYICLWLSFIFFRKLLNTL